jgi:hypothetical protein
MVELVEAASRAGAASCIRAERLYHQHGQRQIADRRRFDKAGPTKRLHGEVEDRLLDAHAKHSAFSPSRSRRWRTCTPRRAVPLISAMAR